MPATVQEVRYELGDVDPSLPLLSATEIDYFLAKNNYALQRTVLDCAKTLLFKLSMRGDETVDIFSVKGSKAAEQYRQALKLFIKNPEFNAMLNLAGIWAGGVSISEMQANDANLDNNIITTPNSTSPIDTTNYFGV